MTKSIVIIALATAIAALAAAEPAFAAKRKKVAACAAGTLCTGPCNSAKWCNAQVCATSGAKTPTLGFCAEGSPFCPPKC